MNKEKLESYTAGIEIELYELAFNMIRINEEIKLLSRFQSHCDFNLFWLYSIAPEVILHLSSIEFLLSIKSNFKRKLTAKELLNYDLIIGLKQPATFDEFKMLIQKINSR